jgi:uncharacterized transporter YbjL
MIAKVEKMKKRQEKYKEGQETKNHTEKELETMLIQLKAEMDDHKEISLPEILKEKHRIVTRIKDYDIDYVLDEETNVNIMPEITWKILGKPTMIPSLGRIGFFKGNMITLCGRFTNIPMISHETSTEEKLNLLGLLRTTPLSLFY